jgi:hypothetical protein
MILSHLSQRIVDAIPKLQDSPHYIRPLIDLLEDLLAWGNRPTYLIPMAYQWCSAISEKIREHGGYELTSEGLPRLQYPNHYVHLLSKSLAIAFRHIGSNSIRPPIRLSHTHHHEWMLDAIFTTENDDLIADAVYVWIVDLEVTPPGSCTRRLLRLTERGQPFSPRLRSTIMLAVEELHYSELEGAGLEFVRLLNNLKVGVDDIGGENWRGVELVTTALRSPIGQRYLSSHYWLLLWNLISVGQPNWSYNPKKDVEVMKSLEEAQDWDKLETWIFFIWRTDSPITTWNEDIERATLTLFQQRPSAIPRFKALYEKRTQGIPRRSTPSSLCEDVFRRVCDQARAEQSRLELSS